MTKEIRPEVEKLLIERFPDPTMRDHALRAAGKTIVSADRPKVLALLAEEWRGILVAEEIARAELTGAVVAASLMGYSENGLSQLTGLARNTVRKAVGK